MNCSKLALVISLAFLLGSCTSLSPVSTLAQVKGVLVDATTYGQPVADATVRLWRVTGVIDGVEISSEQQPVSETKTDGTGAFLFADVPLGRYLLLGTRKVESDDLPLRLMKYNGAGENPAIDVSAGQEIDLGAIKNCRHTVCGPAPTVTPTAVR